MESTKLAVEDLLPRRGECPCFNFVAFHTWMRGINSDAPCGVVPSASALFHVPARDPCNELGGGAPLKGTPRDALRAREVVQQSISYTLRAQPRHCGDAPHLSVHEDSPRATHCCCALHVAICEGPGRSANRSGDARGSALCAALATLAPLHLTRPLSCGLFRRPKPVKVRVLVAVDPRDGCRGA